MGPEYKSVLIIGPRCKTGVIPSVLRGCSALFSQDRDSDEHGGRRHHSLTAAVSRPRVLPSASRRTCCRANGAKARPSWNCSTRTDSSVVLARGGVHGLHPHPHPHPHQQTPPESTESSSGRHSFVTVDELSMISSTQVRACSRSGVVRHHVEMAGRVRTGRRRHGQCGKLVQLVPPESLSSCPATFHLHHHPYVPLTTCCQQYCRAFFVHSAHGQTCCRTVRASSTLLSSPPSPS
jgi:hypothetical protein